ncbi:MAG: glycosyltransferase family 39 protein [Acidobacteria bacterium]|nr:glycosyltransferase family 39 protein [Acidobacteriota bacterium]
MHYLLSIGPSLRDAYLASLATAHPPLLIILLHYWGKISASEFFLRLPSVIAGTAAGWFLYAWLLAVAGRETALVALALFLFSPALIYSSAEVRQYALLLLFMSVALWCLDRAFAIGRARWMLLSAAALYLALLTHYCALIFAASLGGYGLLRILSRRPAAPWTGVWMTTQLGAGSIAGFLWKTHISLIRHRPLTQDVAQSYLRSSLFHAGQENVLSFLARSHLRLFHFLFSQGAVSVLGLVLFAAGIVLLLGEKNAETGPRGPAPRQFGILLLSPFLINLAAALAAIYPYGGTRHNAYLAIFAFAAMAVAITRLHFRWKWAKALAMATLLAISNLTVVPAGAYIRPKNQKKEWMEKAVAYLKASAPPGSVLLTDYESGLLLSYYLCGTDITHAGEPVDWFYQSRCGEYESVSLLPRLWVFRIDTFPEQMRELAPALPPGREVWLFQAGFIVDREPEFQALLADYGCASPEKFGANILVCRIHGKG